MLKPSDTHSVSKPYGGIGRRTPFDVLDSPPGFLKALSERRARGQRSMTRVIVAGTASKRVISDDGNDIINDGSERFLIAPLADVW